MHENSEFTNGGNQDLVKKFQTALMDTRRRCYDAKGVYIGICLDDTELQSFASATPVSVGDDNYTISQRMISHIAAKGHLIRGSECHKACIDLKTDILNETIDYDTFDERMGNGTTTFTSLSEIDRNQSSTEEIQTNRLNRESVLSMLKEKSYQIANHIKSFADYELCEMELNNLIVKLSKVQLTKGQGDMFGYLGERRVSEKRHRSFYE